jgi:hypothetical protein
LTLPVEGSSMTYDADRRRDPAPINTGYRAHVDGLWLLCPCFRQRGGGGTGEATSPGGAQPSSDDEAAAQNSAFVSTAPHTAAKDHATAKVATAHGQEANDYDAAN